MWAYSTRHPTLSVDFVLPEQVIPLAHWCKHARLRSWVKGLYGAKGGACFGFMPMRLDLEDLAALEREVVAVFDRHREADLAFIAAARRAIRASRFVVFDAWASPPA